MYDKYKTLQKQLKKLVVRAKEGTCTVGGEEQPQIMIDISGEMKLQELHINDDALLDPSKKKELTDLIMKCFQKAQNKAQEVVGEKTKEVLGFDPSDMGNMMGGGGGGIPGLGS